MKYQEFTDSCIMVVIRAAFWFVVIVGIGKFWFDFDIMQFLN